MKTFIKMLFAILLVPGFVACGDIGDGDPTGGEIPRETVREPPGSAAHVDRTPFLGAWTVVEGTVKAGCDDIAVRESSVPAGRSWVITLATAPNKIAVDDGRCVVEATVSGRTAVATNMDCADDVPMAINLIVSDGTMTATATARVAVPKLGASCSIVESTTLVRP